MELDNLWTSKRCSKMSAAVFACGIKNELCNLGTEFSANVRVVVDILDEVNV